MARKKSAAATESSGATLAKAIRQCVDSGKVLFGSNEGIKRSLMGSAKLVILAGNCPKEISQDASRFCRLSGIPAIKFEGTSLELGTVAGRPHSVAMLTVLETGNSDILEFAK